MAERESQSHARLRVLLVVSRVTFVPGNYDDLVCAMAECPQVMGLLVLDNWSVKLMGRALGLMLIGAPRMGATLLANCLGASRRRRERAFAKAGKSVWEMSTINCPEAVDLVRRERIDLIVNCRTRFIYRSEILAAPRLGCINMHHGLLPDQRGTTCDLWALHEHRAAGFTIHQMSEQVDAGGIIQRVEIGANQNYRSYLQRCTLAEAFILRLILLEIERRGSVWTQPNVPTDGVTMRRNPTVAQLRQMTRGGLRL
jgi:methionyl-tRNA formyltransferase